MISLATRPIMQNLVIVRYIYPALSSPPPALQFDDQFAFRPTGSTTAAIVHLLDSVIKLLDTEPYAIVISLDFSKAFDTYGTRHYSVKWLIFIFLIKYTTGWWTSLTINRIPRRTVLTPSYQCQYYPGVSYRTSRVCRHRRRPRRHCIG